MTWLQYKLKIFLRYSFRRIWQNVNMSTNGKSHWSCALYTPGHQQWWQAGLWHCDFSCGQPGLDPYCHSLPPGGSSPRRSTCVGNYIPEGWDDLVFYKQTLQVTLCSWLTYKQTLCKWHCVPGWLTDTIFPCVLAVFSICRQFCKWTAVMQIKQNYPGLFDVSTAV